MIRRLVVLALLVGGAVLLEPLRAPTEGVIAPRSLFLFGILLLTADTFGAMAHDVGLPRLIGYLVAGLALGPSLSGIVPAGVLEDLSMMKRLAVGLIGLLAGAELRTRRPQGPAPDDSVRPGAPGVGGAGLTLGFALVSRAGCRFSQGLDAAPLSSWRSSSRRL